MSPFSSTPHLPPTKRLTMPVAVSLLACALASCGGSSNGGSDVAGSVTITVPGAPSIGIATPGNASASVGFTAPASNGGATITGYSATCSGGGATHNATGTASPINVTGLSNGTAYNCAVSASNSAGNGAASAAVSVTPAAPIGVVAPGAPVIGAATPGDASARIGFTAPASNGGATITGYSATCTAGSTSRTGTGSTSPISVTLLSNGTAFSCAVVAINSAGSGAASASVSVTPVAAGTSGTAGVLCGISGSEFNNDESVNLTATYSWVCGSTSRVLSSNGVPNHIVGTFPGPGNPNTIGAVTTSATYSLAPTATGSNTTVITSGYALNGVKMEPGTAGTCGNTGGSSCNQANGTGPWNMEALGQSAFNFGADENNAHVQPNGAYHYHGMPERFITKLGKGTSTMTLVGWAPDGFPIYARYGYNTANDATSGVKVLRGSYSLKTTPDANRPATTTYAMGTFTQDYQYVAGSGDLDECNGRTGVTPEFPSGSYHYMVTDTYPFIGRCVKGTAASIR